MMTFRFAKCAVAIGAIGLAGVLQSSAQAADGTATATATVATAISIVKNVDMDFGTITEAGAGTVILATDGSRTTTAGASILASGPGAAADFTVSGEDSATYSITLPTPPVTLTFAANTMDITAFSSSPAEGANGTMSAGPCPCNETLLVGGTLSIAVGQAPGTYVTGGTFTVTVNYN